MSDPRFPSQRPNKPQLQPKFFHGQPPKRLPNMGSFPRMSHNSRVPRMSKPVAQPTYHDPNKIMKSWFDDDRHPPELPQVHQNVHDRSWAHYSTTEASTNISEDLWESDLSDDVISAIMTDAFEEKIIQLSQQKVSSKISPSTSSTSTPSTSTSKYSKEKPSPSLCYESQNPPNKSKSSETLASFPHADKSRGPLPASNLKNTAQASKNSLYRTSSGNHNTSQSSYSISVLSQSQRKLARPTSSLTQSHTTEWLRSQLEKVNKEYSSLKETVTVKDGESKILREKLNEAKMTIEKQKIDKEIECSTIRTELEDKIKSLKKELQNAKTQILFKSKEIESNRDKFKELKKVQLVQPEYSQTAIPLSQKLKSFINRNERPKHLGNITCLTGEFSEAPSILVSPPTKSINDSCVQTDELPKSLDTFPPGKSLIDSSESHHGFQLCSLVAPRILKEAKPEISSIVPPSMDYIGFNILYRDISEIPEDDNDDADVIENLIKVWKLKNPPCIKKKPKNLLRRRRHFTSLHGIHQEILQMFDLPHWRNSPIPVKIIQHVTHMARELYIAFRERDVSRHPSIPFREMEVTYDSPDISELEENFDSFSPEKWKKEKYVDLRRGISLLAHMCDIEPSLQLIILEKSHFSVSTSKKVFPYNFTSSEINEISCISDTFTNDFDKPTYLLPLSCEEKLLGRRNDFVAKHKEKNLRDPPDEAMDCEILSYEEVKDHASELNDLASSIRNIIKVRPGQVKLKTSEFLTQKVDDVENISLVSGKTVGDLMKEVFTKLGESLANTSTAKRENLPDKKIEISIVDQFALVNQDKWKTKANIEISASPPPENRRSLIKASSQKCINKAEKELISLTYRNFLKIKESLEWSSNPSKKNIDSLPGSSLHPDCSYRYDVPMYLLDYKKSSHSRKRKNSTDEDLQIEEVGKKRDIAPLKKPREDKGNNIMGTEELEKELEKIFPSGKNKDSDIDKRKSKEVPSKKTPPLEVTDEEFVEDEGERMDRKDEIVLDWKDVELPDDYMFPEDIAVQCELLEILIEIVRQICYLKYSRRFTPFLSVTLDLLISLTKPRAAMMNNLRVEHIVSFLLEIIYCRPSALVLLKIQILLAQCVSINGFSRLLCTNAHPEKYVVKPRRIEFKRGACLISVLCTITDFSVTGCNWDIQYHFFSWVSQIFLVEKRTIYNLYKRQKTTCGRCSCIRSMNNCIIRLLTSAVVSFYGYTLENNLSPCLKEHLIQIILQGVRILSVIVDIDKYFAQNIPTQYEAFVMFLETVKHFHTSPDFDFSLCDCDLNTVNLLLKEESIAKKLKKKVVNANDLQSMSPVFAPLLINVRKNILNDV